MAGAAGRSTVTASVEVVSARFSGNTVLSVRAVPSRQARSAAVSDEVTPRYSADHHAGGRRVVLAPSTTTVRAGWVTRRRRRRWPARVRVRVQARS